MNDAGTERADRRYDGYREEYAGPERTDVSQETGQGNGGLSVGDYQRLRRGYERTINPEALQKMNQGDYQSDYQGEDGDHHEDRPTGASVQTSRRVVRIRPETYVPVDPGREWREEYREEGRRGRIGPIAVFLILVIGLVGGLVLYAGGSDFIAGLFGEEEQEYGEDLTLVTERPGAEFEVTDPSPTPGDMVSEEGEEEEITGEELLPEEDLAAAEAEERRLEQERARLQQEAEQRRAEERRAAAAERSREPESTPVREVSAVESTGEREVAPSPRSNATSTSTLQSASSTGRYVAQVGATPDRGEADRIAARLRARGGSSVTVVAAEKNGTPIYRVRFGSFTSETEARQKSTELGFSDVWIIQR